MSAESHQAADRAIQMATAAHHEDIDAMATLVAASPVSTADLFAGAQLAALIHQKWSRSMGLSRDESDEAWQALLLDLEAWRASRA